MHPLIQIDKARNINSTECTINPVQVSKASLEVCSYTRPPRKCGTKIANQGTRRYSEQANDIRTRCPRTDMISPSISSSCSPSSKFFLSAHNIQSRNTENDQTPVQEKMTSRKEEKVSEPVCEGVTGFQEQNQARSIIPSHHITYIVDPLDGVRTTILSCNSCATRGLALTRSSLSFIYIPSYHDTCTGDLLQRASLALAFPLGFRIRRKTCFWNLKSCVRYGQPTA